MLHLPPVAAVTEYWSPTTAISCVSIKSSEGKHIFKFRSNVCLMNTALFFFFGFAEISQSIEMDEETRQECFNKSFKYFYF